MKVDRSEMDKARNDIHSQIQTMGNNAVEALRNVAEAFNHRDSERAQKIIEGDAQFNLLYQSIHDQCLILIARHQPVASELREIITDLQIAVELERIADHVAAIARVVKTIKSESTPPVWIEIMNMIRHCVEMMEKMLKAYQESDKVSAEVIATTDEEIDRLNNLIVSEILHFMKENENAIENGTYLIWLVHHVERIGDRITNIGEQILFSASGEIIDWNISKNK